MTHIVIVDLPEPDDVNGEDYDAWWGHPPDTERWSNYAVSAFDGRCGYGAGGQFTPDACRRFAAALLAAANVAERTERNMACDQTGVQGVAMEQSDFEYIADANRLTQLAKNSPLHE